MLSERIPDESLRRRLEALNRGPLPAPTIAHHTGEVASPGLSLSKSATGKSDPMIAPHAPHPKTPQPFSPGFIRTGEPVETPFGQHLRIRLSVESLWRNAAQLIAARHEFLQSHLTAAQQAVEPTIVIDAEFAALIASLPDRTIALDLETCGLAGSALFLIGLFRQVDGLPTVELLLARNYAEEAAVLASLWQIIAGCDVLLTFNGKTFDWPMVLERSVRHRLQTNAIGERLLHIDILHHARRRWRKHLPNCRLLTLEQYVCRRKRAADIPGHCIPAVYADYVRTGFERDMETVLHHNALDLVTLFDLALRLAA
jgi:uncharacterized protein YprB with RNaseH-like and TPR domain